MRDISRLTSPLLSQEVEEVSLWPQEQGTSSLTCSQEEGRQKTQLGETKAAPVLLVPSSAPQALSSAPTG